MKKRLVIYTSIMAFALSICLFVFSVFAVGHDFSINNKIVFEGTSEYLVFDVNAEVTGTTKDGSDALKTEWKYDKGSEEYSESSFEWNIPEVLTFDTEGKSFDDICITYSFVVTNKSVGSSAVNVYIEDPINFDNDALTYEIDGSSINKKRILPDATGTVTLKLKPKTGEFSGERQINFNLKIEEAF